MAENLIFNEPALAFADLGNGLFAWQSDTNIIPLTVGETYIVEWDGTRHTCQAVSTVFNDADVVVMGNFGLLGSGENNGMPFLMGSALAGDLSLCYTTDNDATNAVAIYHVTEDAPEEEEPDKEYLIWGSTLKGIANAIREKTGGTADIDPVDMPTEIRSIAGGGSSDVEVVYVTFMTHDGLTELHKRAVVPGNDCMDIVAGGLIDAPTRESTASQVFTFAGWSTVANGGLDENALKNVTTDRTVYANYIAATRYYTVRFYDGDTLLNTMQVPYGGMADYTTEKEGYQFDGWEPSNINITADTDCFAQWSEKLTFANATWAQIAEISEAGEAANYFAVGDTKQVVWGDDTITVAIAGLNHDDLADGSGKAGISIICMTVPDYPIAWATSYNSNYNSQYRYNGTRTQIRTVLNGDIWNGLPTDLQSVIKSVNKLVDADLEKSSIGAHNTTTISEKLWLPSMDEVGQSTSAESYAPGSERVAVLGSKYDLFTEADFWSETGDNKFAMPRVTIGSTTTYADWWTRTMCRSGSMSYPGIFTMGAWGSWSNYSAISILTLTSSTYSKTKYIRFGFCV